MKITCTTSELRQALNNVFHAVPSRTTNKILEGVLLDVTPARMMITGTDTNMTITSSIMVVAEASVAIVVPAKLFVSIVSKLPKDEVMLDYDADKRSLQIKSGRSVTELVCFDADEFPRLLTPEITAEVHLRKEDVRKLIQKTVFSASADEINGILTGVLCEVQDGKVQMVAVDAFRMAIYNEETPTPDAPVQVVIPAKMLSQVSKIITDGGDEELLLQMMDKKAIFQFDNNRITVNTLSGKYIDYRRIIQTESTTTLRVKREELISSIDRAALLASSATNNMIKFDIGDDVIEISSLSDEGNINEAVEVIKEGKGFRIGFNSKYLMDILRNIEDEEVMMYMKDSISPCIFRPLSGDHYLYLVLPVRIN